MKFLIIEDDAVSRKLMGYILKDYGSCDYAENGVDAVKAFKAALRNNEPYDLLTMDIMMPKLDGQGALKEIREVEKSENSAGKEKVKVIMTTALGNPKNVIEAFYKGGALAYLVKPFTKDSFLKEMRKLGFAV